MSYDGDSVTLDIPFQAFINNPEGTKSLVLSGVRSGILLTIRRLQRLEKEFESARSLNPCGPSVKDAIAVLTKMYQFGLNEDRHPQASPEESTDQKPAL